MTDQPTANGHEEQRVQVQVPPLMAQVPARFNVLELDRADGVKQTILLINSTNGTFGFPIDPDPADAIADALKASAARCRGGLLTPPSILLGPGGAPLNFGGG